MLHVTQLLDMKQHFKHFYTCLRMCNCVYQPLEPSLDQRSAQSVQRIYEFRFYDDVKGLFSLEHKPST
jgi:hypothetical protein